MSTELHIAANHHDSSHTPTSDRGRAPDRRVSSRKKQFRWGLADHSAPSGLHAFPFIIPGELSLEQQETLLLRCRIEDLHRRLTQQQIEVHSSDRNPSPEPVYDDRGKRTNTREQRARDRVQEELNKLVDLAFLMEPKFRPPSTYDPKAVRKSKRIPIPVDRFPNYNFLGLILGPRGNTQKMLEKQTGCKISIRGKVRQMNRIEIYSSQGSQIGNKKRLPDEDEPLYVLITGSTNAQVNSAAKIINEILIPVEDEKNDRKKTQLKELATILGLVVHRPTYKSSEHSHLKANVSCAICGDASHPAMDCPLRGDMKLRSGHLEQEYESFLSAIGEKRSMVDVYKEFQNALST